MILHSIKWRLQVWHGFLLLCLVSGAMAGFYAYERRVRLQAVDNELVEAITPLMPRLAPPDQRRFSEFGPPEAGRRPPPRDLDGPQGDEGFPPDGGPDGERPFRVRPREALQNINLGKIYYLAWSETGERFAGSTNAPTVDKPQLLKDQKGGRILRTRGENRELVQFVPTGRCLLVGTSLAPTMAGLKHLAATLALIGLGVVLLGLAVGWFLVTHALHPIQEISLAAREIAAGDLSRRINPSQTESELGQLAAVLNSTFARLEAAFAQQKQFTSDAAHELRTPVSVILTQVQGTLKKERTGAEYRETLEACQRAAQRMRRLIESLLELARWDAGQETLQQTPFNVSRVAENALDLVRPLAQERGVFLQSELTEAECVGDSERLGQVFTNLLTNAILHNSTRGEVRLTTRRENHSVLVTVTDKGPGIAQEDLPRIFERFYRGDKSRTGSTGGTGLGLAISKAIVEAHGGSIQVASQVGEGTSFTVRLPVKE